MDTRKSFVVDIIAGAIAPQQQKVINMGQTQPPQPTVQGLMDPGDGLQAAYADYLAKDDSGAIAAFLDDPSTSLLQISLAKSGSGQLQVRLANSADFPKGCFYQVCSSSRYGLRAPVLSGAFYQKQHHGSEHGIASGLER